MHKKGKKIVHSLQKYLFYRTNARGKKNTVFPKKKKFYLQTCSRFGQMRTKSRKLHPKPKNPELYLMSHLGTNR